jgi:hypothetical protein
LNLFNGEVRYFMTVVRIHRVIDVAGDDKAELLFVPANAAGKLSALTVARLAT